MAQRKRQNSKRETEMKFSTAARIGSQQVQQQTDKHKRGFTMHKKGKAPERKPDSGTRQKRRRGKSGRGCARVEGRKGEGTVSGKGSDDDDGAKPAPATPATPALAAGEADEMRSMAE